MTDGTDGTHVTDDFAGIAEIMKSSKYLFPPLAFAQIFFVAFAIFLLR